MVFDLLITDTYATVTSNGLISSIGLLLVLVCHSIVTGTEHHNNMLMGVSGALSNSFSFIHTKTQIQAYQNNIYVSCYFEFENMKGRSGLFSFFYIFYSIMFRVYVVDSSYNLILFIKKQKEISQTVTTRWNNHSLHIQQRFVSHMFKHWHVRIFFRNFMRMEILNLYLNSHEQLCKSYDAGLCMCQIWNIWDGKSVRFGHLGSDKRWLFSYALQR